MVKKPFDNFLTIVNVVDEKLFTKDKSVTTHHKNLQVLATELYKVHHQKQLPGGVL